MSTRFPCLARGSSLGRDLLLTIKNKLVTRHPRQSPHDERRMSFPQPIVLFIVSPIEADERRLIERCGFQRDRQKFLGFRSAMPDPPRVFAFSAQSLELDTVVSVVREVLT